MHVYVWLAHKIDTDTYPSFLVSILVLSANTLITVPTGGRVRLWFRFRFRFRLRLRCRLRVRARLVRARVMARVRVRVEG